MSNLIQIMTTLRNNIDTVAERDRGFAKDLVRKFDTYGTLSEKQLFWAKKLARIDQPTEQHIAVTSTRMESLQKIHELFDKAEDSGLKTPALRMQVDEHRINIRRKGQNLIFYAGVWPESWRLALLTRSGALSVVGAEKVPGFLPALMNLAESPLESMKAYGRRTGECCMCGRELTNHASIDAGIGPICAGKWGV